VLTGSGWSLGAFSVARVPPVRCAPCGLAREEPFVVGPIMVSLPDLPVTYRPRWGRIVPYSLAVVVLALCTALAIALPGGPHGFRPLDRLGVFGIGVLSSAFLCVLARPHVIALPSGLRVVNLFRARTLEWAEVIQVNLRSGDPWVLLDLSDGDTLAAMGIQANDGLRAQRAAQELQRLVAAHSLTERDD
jgi:hypothetical protein